MRVRGSIYVLSSPLFPDLSQISFSVKSPELRVKEMLRKKPDQPLVIEYAVIVDSPHKYHRVVCQRLKDEGKHERKEWFRCPPEEAAVAIREAIGKNRIYSEVVRGVERIKRVREDDEERAPLPKIQFVGQEEREQKSGKAKEGSSPDEDERPVVLTETAEGRDQNEKRSSSGTERAPTSRASFLNTHTAEEEKSPEEYLLQQQREALRREQEEVRRTLEEKRKMAHRPVAKEKTKTLVEDQGHVTSLWEIIVILLTDLGCIYLIFAAQSVAITVVALVLSAFFSLLLIETIRSYRRKGTERKNQPSP